MTTYSLGRRRVIALLFLSSLLLITLDIRGSAAIDRLRSGFALILQPFDTAARAVSRPVVNACHGISRYDDVRRENELLREQVAHNRGAAIEAMADILEYQNLLQLNQLIGVSNYPKVTAQVQGASPSNFQYTVEISKGSNDGIRVGMPVVNGAGLVGKITEVFPNSSIVLLITDPEFSIGAKILTERIIDPVVTQPKTEETTPGGLFDPNSITTTTLDPTETTEPGVTETGTTTTTVPTAAVTTTTDLLTSVSPDDSGLVVDPLSTDPTQTTVAPETTTTTTPPTIEIVRETGTLRGQGPGRPLLIEFIEQTSTTNTLKAGSPVQTAGGAAGIAPAGLPIGLVSSVKSQKGSSVPIVEVTSAAGDLSRLTFVTVLLYLPNSGG